jgi:hypothetical protein
MNTSKTIYKQTNFFSNQTEKEYQLEIQAWNLCMRLDRQIEINCIGPQARLVSPLLKERLLMAHMSAYERFKRRQEKLFNYFPQTNIQLIGNSHVL